MPRALRYFSSSVLVQLAALVVLVLSQDIYESQGSRNLHTLPCNFTLAAVNVSLPNANSTGAPLVLGAGGATAGIVFYVTSTYFSFPYNDHPTLGLVNNALRAYDPNGDWRTNATYVRGGDRLVWSTSTMYPNPEENNRIYSATRSHSSSYPTLAAYNVSTLWSLCPFPGFRGQTQLVFNVSAVKPPPYYIPYDPDLCYDVTVNLVPVEN